MNQLKKQLLEGASGLFKQGKKFHAMEESQAKEVELFQQIGRLQLDMEWHEES